MEAQTALFAIPAPVQPVMSVRPRQPQTALIHFPPRGEPVEPPPRRPTFNGELYPFQAAGVRFIRARNGRALLADDMGLGKTIQALAFIASTEGSLPALVVAPSALLTQWESEITRFIRFSDGSRPRVHRLKGLASRELPAADFYLAHYDLLSPRRTRNPNWQGRNSAEDPEFIIASPGRAPDLARRGIATLILDEVQALRSRKTARFAALKAMLADSPPRYAIGLSGTPIYNRGEELWPILHAIKPGLLGNFREFSRDWLYPLNHDRYMLRRPVEFGELLAREVMLRRTKTDVAEDLPAKLRHHHAVSIDGAQYDRHMREIAAQYYSGGGELSIPERNARSMAALSRERRATGLLKVPALAEWVHTLLDADSDRKVVLFAHHQGAIQGYAQKLAAYNPMPLTGHQDADERAESVAEFRDGDSRVLLASLRVAGLGLNLQCANTVVFAEFDWSPAVHLQAEDRCHRIGQARDVTAYYTYAPGTLDEFILERCDRKMQVINAVMGSAEACPPSGADTGARDVMLDAAAELERRVRKSA